MEEKFGIENSKKLIGFVVEMGNVGDKIGQSNRSDWKKYFAIAELFDETVDMVKLDYSMLKNEILDYSVTEKAEIELMVCEKLKIKNVVLEKVIEDCFSILMTIEAQIEKAIEMVRNLRKI